MIWNDGVQGVAEAIGMDKTIGHWYTTVVTQLTELSFYVPTTLIFGFTSSEFAFEVDSKTGVGTGGGATMSAHTAAVNPEVFPVAFVHGPELAPL